MIRAATPGDGPALRRLQGLLAESSPRLLSYALSTPGSPLVLASTVGEGDGEGGGGTGATNGDDPVGYLLGTVGEGAYVAELAVAPIHRREGRATALLRSFVAAAREEGCEEVRVAVAPGNGPARALYRSLEFEVVERREGFYEDGPGVIMRRAP